MMLGAFRQAGVFREQQDESPEEDEDQIPERWLKREKLKRYEPHRPRHSCSLAYTYPVAYYVDWHSTLFTWM